MCRGSDISVIKGDALLPAVAPYVAALSSAAAVAPSVPLLLHPESRSEPSNL